MALYYPPGRYRCRVESQGWAEAKISKRPMIVLEIRPLAKIVQGPEGPEDDYVDGQYTRTVRLVVNADSEKQMDFTMKRLRFAGFDGESFADLNLEGSSVECRCEPEIYEGKEKEAWDLALPPMEAAPSEPIDAKAVRKLDALFGRRLKTDKPKGNGAPASDPQPATVPQSSADDDDLPF